MRAWGRWCLALLLVVLAVWLQSSVLPLLRLPGTYVPLATIVLIAAARNFTSPLAIGLGVAAGFIVDTTPPAAGPVGLMMLACCVIALVVSSWAFTQRADSAGILATWLAVAGFQALLTATRMLIGAIAATGASFSAFAWNVFHDTLLAALLGPLLIPFVDFCLRPRRSERASAYVSWSR